MRLTDEQQALVESHRFLAKAQGRKASKLGGDADDLAGEFLLAMVEAARDYKPAGRSFMAHAGWRMRDRLREYRLASPIVRVPKWWFDKHARSGATTPFVAPKCMGSEALESVPDAGASAEYLAKKEWLRRCIAKLPEPERIVITMRLEGRRRHEIMARLNVGKIRVAKLTESATALLRESANRTTWPSRRKRAAARA